ncbi:ABC transporter substrate-binding protein [Dactylosporangium sp. NPDC000244]|uniref:ABC transporter substrate-binding protein n=1 Tax=Dactylosporangium sp. NPDC000244 TaxID=3154365 RepID=UPI00332DD8E2
MRTRRAAIAAALAVSLLLVAACGDDTGDGSGPGNGSGGGPMKIDALVALSGPLAVIGGAMQQGMDAAVQVINDSGGVLGQPLKINYIDNAGSADQSAAKLQELLSGGKPHAVIPGVASEIPAGIPILAQAGVFTSQHFTGATFNDPKKYPLEFGNAHTIPDYVGSLVSKAKESGYQSVGILDIDDASGQAFEAVAGPAFKAAGIAVTFARVPPDSIDATPQLQQVLAPNPNALIFAGYSPAAGAMAKARAKLAVTLPTIAAQTYSANNLADLAPVSAYDGILFQQLATSVKGTPQTESAAFKKFYDAVLAKSGGKLPFPINTYLVAYHDVILAAAAANLAGSLDAKKMAKALEGAKPADMPLYVSPVTFSADNHFPTFAPADFVFTKYGPVEKGLSVPSAG